MNIHDLHDPQKSVSAKPVFKGDTGSITAIQLLSNKQLKEHITKTPALLVCITGKVIFNNANGLSETLMPGDYIIISPMVKHSLDAEVDSHLLLYK